MHSAYVFVLPYGGTRSICGVQLLCSTAGTWAWTREGKGVKATMAIDGSEPESAGGALIRELSRNILDQDEKQATTLRLKRSTIKRLREQERRWNTSMSLITERALAPVLDELEAADLPDAENGDR